MLFQFLFESETRRQPANDEENRVSVYANLACAVKPTRAAATTVQVAPSGVSGSQRSVTDEVEFKLYLHPETGILHAMCFFIFVFFGRQTYSHRSFIDTIDNNVPAFGRPDNC